MTADWRFLDADRLYAFPITALVIAVIVFITVMITMTTTLCQVDDIAAEWRQALSLVSTKIRLLRSWR